jgi:aryl-alcohol dehydrogenase-like predicted oxidoreductase
VNTPGITSIVNGATSVPQLEENLSAVDIKLSKEEMEACDEVWKMLRPPRLFYGR